MAATCATCMYYDQNRCHRYAPSADDSDAANVSPRVDSTYWCGEWADINANWTTLVPPVPPVAQVVAAIEQAATDIIDALNPL